MIDFKQGNLLEEKADVLVSTVNCVSVMGKGIVPARSWRTQQTRENSKYEYLTVTIVN